MGLIPNPYTPQMDIAKNQIAELNRARVFCDDLRLKNDDYARLLWKLANDINRAMAFEDSGSFQSTVRDFAYVNTDLVDAIDRACAARIEECQQWYDECAKNYETWLAQFDAEG